MSIDISINWFRKKLVFLFVLEIASRHCDQFAHEKWSIHLLKSVKEKKLSSWANGRGRKAYKDSATYLKVICVLYNHECDNKCIDKWLHRDEEILTLNSSVVCLSFKNREGIIKIQVCSSVTDINQINVIFFQ